MNMNLKFKQVLRVFDSFPTNILYAASNCIHYMLKNTGPHSTVVSASDSRARCPVFDTRSGHILSFLQVPLIQEGQLSVTGKNMWCT